uniref:Uncharacterized protein n=2 Tax=Compsopogon caeruleus TaxID=31354 RepID=A0A7S1XBZ9_9RHOD|mmetsp:Transcript_14768/g.30038  ORF Transcript_14768/g.30038 Transcript_14768/m.30038 type:complete len:318 (+) Transcript_14768:725-1678(+)
MLGINLPITGTFVPPCFQEVSSKPIFYDLVDIEESFGRLPAWAPNPAHYCAMHSLLKGTLSSVCSHEETFGLRDRTVHLIATVQAMLYTEESTRICIENLTSKVPDPDSDNAAELFLSGVVREIHEKDYLTRLEAKKKEERVILLDRELENLTSDIGYSQFRDILLDSSLQNRESVGFSRVLEAMLELKRKVRDRQRKLCLLVTGREIDTPEQKIWANGNFLQTGPLWDAVSDVLSSTEDGIQLFRQMQDMRKKYGNHSYRAGQDRANRHGHSNGFPSFWALGFKTLRAYRESAPPDEFEKYVESHCRERQCCLEPY